MGQSTDAMFFFGMDVFSYEEDDEFPETVLEKLSFDKDVDDSRLSVYAVINALDDTLLAESPVGLGTHCHHEWPIVYLYVKKTHLRAHRGYPKNVDPSHMLNHGYEEELTSLLKTAAEELGFTWSKLPNPCWKLASYWG